MMPGPRGLCRICRAVLDLADEMDAELAAQGFVLDGRCILPGDRLRAAVAAAPTRTDREENRP